MRQGRIPFRARAPDRSPSLAPVTVSQSSARNILFCVQQQHKSAHDNLQESSELARTHRTELHLLRARNLVTSIAIVLQPRVQQRACQTVAVTFLHSRDPEAGRQESRERDLLMSQSRIRLARGRNRSPSLAVGDSRATLCAQHLVVSTCCTGNLLKPIVERVASSLVLIAQACIRGARAQPCTEPRARVAASSCAACVPVSCCPVLHSRDPQAGRPENCERDLLMSQGRTRLARGRNRSPSLAPVTVLRIIAHFCVMLPPLANMRSSWRQAGKLRARSYSHQ